MSSVKDHAFYPLVGSRVVMMSWPEVGVGTVVSRLPDKEIYVVEWDSRPGRWWHPAVALTVIARCGTCQESNIVDKPGEIEE